VYTIQQTSYILFLSCFPSPSSTVGCPSPARSAVQRPASGSSCRRLLHDHAEVELAPLLAPWPRPGGAHTTVSSMAAPTWSLRHRLLHSCAGVDLAVERVGGEMPSREAGIARGMPIGALYRNCWVQILSQFCYVILAIQLILQNLLEMPLGYQINIILFNIPRSGRSSA
jgi:hypothetical protein